MLQTIGLFAPIIISAVCIPVLFQRAGYPRRVFWLTWLPAILAISAFLATIFEERSLLGGPLGLWAIAASLLVLAIPAWPRQNGDRRDSQS